MDQQLGLEQELIGDAGVIAARPQLQSHNRKFLILSFFLHLLVTFYFKEQFICSLSLSFCYHRIKEFLYLLYFISIIMVFEAQVVPTVVNMSFISTCPLYSWDIFLVSR